MNNRTLFFLYALVLSGICLVSVQQVKADTFNPATVEQLVLDIQTANANGEDDVINLVPNMVYTITAGAGGGPFSDGNGQNGLPIILSDGGQKLTINGSGATIQRDPTLFSNDPNDQCSGPGIDFRIFQFNPGTDITLDALTISNGCSPGPIGGGGISNLGGDLNIVGTSLLHNSANRGGGLYNQEANTRIANSNISFNKTVITGGGIEHFDDDLLLNTITIINTEVTGNMSDNFVGGISNRGIAIIDNSLIAWNVGNIGGFSNSRNRAQAYITNSTIAFNESNDSAGAIFISGSLTLTNSNIVNNTATNIGGAFFISVSSTSNFKNNLIVGNASATSDNNCVTNFAIITDNGGNISDDNTDACAFAFDPSFDTLTMLGPLQDNGGPTDTVALIPTIGPANPAIDAILPANCTDQQPVPAPITEDQRGVARPQGTNCDVGAFELIADSDGDGVNDDLDNCPDDANPAQTDSDGDGGGDACDACVNDPDNDADSDGVCGDIDNCPLLSNPDQADVNMDGFGDACVSPDTDLGDDVEIGAGSTVGDGSSIKDGSTIGENTSIGEDVEVKGDVEVGDNSEIGDGTQVKDGASIGDDTSIGEDSQVKEDADIGNNVIIGMNVQIDKNVVIEDNVTIGDNTIIKANTTIKAGSIIGMDCIIGRDVTVGTNVSIGDNQNIKNKSVIPDNSIIP